ncbi:MAG: sigma-70 family RNA polymerase sigma factor [Candidatus Hydrogenedentes bacterium]|nr:sigma-70 family RNA polymerase sigma factor [Candidatus Hydrogenedentota bacterium]
MTGHDEYERVIGPIEDDMLRAVWSITQNPHDAEEALQSALCTVWHKWERICSHNNPRALVLRICMNASYDLLRKKIRRRRYESLPDALQPGAAATPAEEADRAERRSAIALAIGTLSRNQSVAVVMRFVQGQSYTAISHVLGCRSATARKHVQRGRERLRVLLAPLTKDFNQETAQ